MILGVYKIATNLISFPSLPFFNLSLLLPFPSLSPLFFFFFHLSPFLPLPFPIFPLPFPFPSSPFYFLLQQLNPIPPGWGGGVGGNLIHPWILWDVLRFIIFRILGKYYDKGTSFATPVEQKKFEKSLFNKTHKVSKPRTMGFFFSRSIWFSFSLST